MGAFDEIIRAAMKADGVGEETPVALDNVPPHKRMDDTKTPEQKQRDAKKITGQGTRPALPSDVVDPDMEMENREIPPSYIMQYLNEQSNKKKDRKA